MIIDILIFLVIFIEVIEMNYYFILILIQYFTFKFNNFFNKLIINIFINI